MVYNSFKETFFHDLSDRIDASKPNTIMVQKIAEIPPAVVKKATASVLTRFLVKPKALRVTDTRK